MAPETFASVTNLDGGDYDFKVLRSLGTFGHTYYLLLTTYYLLLTTYLR